MVAAAVLATGCSDSTPATDGAAQLQDAAPHGKDARGDLAVPDAPAPDRGSDAFVPFSFSLTVNRIPTTMNGSTPFKALDLTTKSYRLTVPTHGFSLDVAWAGTNAVGSSLRVRANRALGAGAGQLPAGADISGEMVKAAGKATLLVPSSLSLAPGTVTFSATVQEGAVERSAAITVDVAQKTFLLDPFRLEDTWVLIFSRDVAAITSGLDAKGQWSLWCKMGKNGVVDLEEDLRVIGLSTPKMRTDCAKVSNRGVTGTNAIMRAWLEALIVAAVRKAFLVNADGTRTAASVGIRVLHELDPAAPALSTFSYQKLKGGETTKNFSAISIGGGDLSKSFLGRSKTSDYRNVQNEDNLSPDYGVLSTNALGYLISTLNKDASLKMLLQQLLGDFLPELGTGGERVGESPLDAVILAKGFDPAKATGAAAARYNKLTFGIELFGRLLGALAAHEMGHSLGLVPGGAPPHGLFGGEQYASFVNPARTKSGHIDTPGFNLMEAGPSSAPGVPLNLMAYLTEPRFNELNTAYLQGRLLLLPK